MVIVNPCPRLGLQLLLLNPTKVAFIFKTNGQNRVLEVIAIPIMAFRELHSLPCDCSSGDCQLAANQALRKIGISAQRAQ
jgi:hypothetical protein